MMNANELVGTHDILLLTLDTLRYDVARDTLRRGRTPNLAAVLPGGRWEKRHAPGNFTYAAHQAFFAGFLPTPARPGKHPRLFALRFPGSETATAATGVLDAPDLVTGLAGHGYHTACIGGVGFFNKFGKQESPYFPGNFKGSGCRTGSQRVLAVVEPSITLRGFREGRGRAVLGPLPSAGISCTAAGHPVTIKAPAGGVRVAARPPRRKACP